MVSLKAYFKYAGNYFRKKTPSQILDTVLNTPLGTAIISDCQLTNVIVAQTLRAREAFDLLNKILLFTEISDND